MKSKDTYKEVRVLTFPQGVATIHIPDLTEEERSRRMREIERAAARLLASRK